MDIVCPGLRECVFVCVRDREKECVCVRDRRQALFSVSVTCTPCLFTCHQIYVTEESQSVPTLLERVKSEEPQKNWMRGKQICEK